MYWNFNRNHMFISHGEEQWPLGKAETEEMTITVKKCVCVYVYICFILNSKQIHYLMFSWLLSKHHSLGHSWYIKWYINPYKQYIQCFIKT